MRISTARTADLDASTRASIVELCVAAHREEDFRNLFTRYLSSGGGWHFLVHLDRELVSHAVVTTRWLQPEGERLLKTAYVDAVATLRTRQGRGYASALFRRMAEEIASEYEIACLETEIPSFYERLGWELWRGPLAGRSDDGLLPTPHQRGVMILRLSNTTPLNVDDGLTIECQPGRIW